MKKFENKKYLDSDKASIYIISYFKEIRIELQELSIEKNFPGILQAIVNLLRSLLQNAHFNCIGKHVKFMGWIYQHGNDYVKYLIENILVRSFDGIRNRSQPDQWESLLVRFPKPLKHVYQSQHKLMKNQSK